MTTIVVGYTRTDTAEEATRHAFSLAEALGAKVQLVTCVEKNESEVIGVGSDRYEVDNLDRIRHQATQFAAALNSPVTHEVLASEGDPAKVLVDVATKAEADVIVVGNVRMQGITRVLGSVGSAVVQNAPCNVYIVKTT